MGLRRQHFPDNNTIITAVRKWIASTGAEFYELEKMHSQWWRLCGTTV
jgi:hypothetical protein